MGSFAINTPLTVLRTFRSPLLTEARMRILESAVHPLVRPVVGNDLNGELQLTVECCSVLAAIDVDEVPAPRNFEPALPQEPLIDLHLTLVGLLPFAVQGNLF